MSFNQQRQGTQKPRVKLIGTDGNAFAIMGKVSQALKRAGQPEKAKEFMEKAVQGDYNHLLNVVMDYVDVS